METMIALLEKSEYVDGSNLPEWIEFSKGNEASRKTVRIYETTERILLKQEVNGEVVFAVSHFYAGQDDVLRILKRNCFI